LETERSLRQFTEDDVDVLVQLDGFQSSRCRPSAVREAL
jgi:hypothetical protein